MEVTRVWFVTDIHGSNLCFRKFINSVDTPKNPNVLILGGDITGKYLVPIVRRSRGWDASFAGERIRLETENEITIYERRLGDAGAYSIRCEQDLAESLCQDEELLDQVIRDLKIGRMREWIELTEAKLNGRDVKIFINSGNDDPFYIDDILDQSRLVVRPEAQVLDIDENNLTMISCGFANRTPWDCPRDISEEDLWVRINAMASLVPDFGKCIFNLHCPPFGTILDRVASLNKDFTPTMTGLGIEESSVGSTSVRKAIEEFQPCVSLHGHIHEQHNYVRLGQTLAFNPGSEYTEGRLRGVYLEFKRGRLQRYGLTRETLPKPRAQTPGRLSQGLWQWLKSSMSG